MRTAAAVVIAMSIASQPASAAATAKTFSGEDAVAIDWGVKNCGLTSTPAEHTLVEAANAKNTAAFNKQYLQQFNAKSWNEALGSTASKDAMCATIKGRYGPQGSRFADLVKWEGTPSPPASAKSAGSTEAKSKGKDRRH